MKKIENYSLISTDNNSNKIRILLVDDQSFVRRFISKSLESISNVSIVGTAENGREAIEKVKSLQPDIVLIDLEMPEMDGVTATKIISQQFPNSKILILSSHNDSDRLRKSLLAGAKGYLLKGSSTEELTDAINSVCRGYTQLSSGLIEKVLTPEVEVVTEAESAQSSEPDRESEWAESTREAIETMPRVSLRGLLYLLLMAIVVAIPWALFAKVDEVGSARGKLEPKGKVIKLDSPVNGTVMSIYVKEGERVKAGQSLLELESELVESEREQQQQKLIAQQNRLDRLQSLKDRQLISLRAQEQQNQAQQFEKQALIDRAKQTFLGAKSAYNSQMAESAALVKQAKDAIAARESERNTAQIGIETGAEKVARYQEAFDEGIIAKERLLEATKELREAKESLNRTTAEIAQARSVYRERQNGYQKLQRQTSTEIEQAQISLQEQQRGYDSLIKSNQLALLKGEEELKTTESEIATVEGEIAQTNSILAGLKYQLKQRVLYAPVKGTIFQLPIQKPGAVVQPGQNVAQIAPNGSPLVFRGKMSSDDSGFLKVGLPVKLKFDAYPFQDYGIVSGVLKWVSPDSKTASNSSSSNTSESGSAGERDFFEVEIELEQNYIQSGDRQIRLTPGQTATAEIIIRQRRLADIFIAPFKSLQKGGIQL